MDCTSSEFTINHLSWPDSQVMIELKNRRLMAAMLAKNGTVNVSKLKKTISTISAMGGKEDPTREWPDAMGYQALSVDASLLDEQVDPQARLAGVHSAGNTRTGHNPNRPQWHGDDYRGDRDNSFGWIRCWSTYRCSLSKALQGNPTAAQIPKKQPRLWRSHET